MDEEAEAMASAYLSEVDDDDDDYYDEVQDEGDFEDPFAAAQSELDMEQTTVGIVVSRSGLCR